MQIEAEIYTSAPKLLDGSGHLGVVARTLNFPKDLENALGFIRNYTFLPALPVDQPGQHPPRFVLIPMGSWYNITRTVYAGADHTGRTTPLSHHLMISLNQLQLTKSSIGMLLEVLLPTFKDSWSSPPQIINSDNVNVPTHSNNQHILGSCWPIHLDRIKLTQIVFYIADCIAHYKATKRSVVLVTQPDASIQFGGILFDILSLLPCSWQYELSCATHVIQQSDQIRDTALIFTYPSTQFFESTKCRQDSAAPIIIDLTTISSEAPDIKYQGYGTILNKLWDSNSNAEIYEFIQLCNATNVTLNNFADAATIMSTKKAMRSISAADQLISISADFERLQKIQGAGALLEQCAYEMVKNRLPNLTINEYGRSLAFICCDRRWPKEISELAKQVICSEPEKYILALLASGSSNHDTQVDSKRLLGQLISQHPMTISRLIAKSTSDTNAANAAVNIVVRANVRVEAYLTWAEDIIKLGSEHEIRSCLLENILKKLCQCPVNDVLLQCKQRYDLHNKQNMLFACEICRPVFTYMIQHIGTDSAPDGLAQSLIEVAAYMGDEQEVVQILASSKLKLDNITIRAWSDIVIGISGNDAARRFELALMQRRPVPIREQEIDLEKYPVSPQKQRRLDISRPQSINTNVQERIDIPDSSWWLSLLHRLCVGVSIASLTIAILSIVSIFLSNLNARALWLPGSLVLMLFIFQLIELFLRRKQVIISKYRRNFFYTLFIRISFLLMAVPMTVVVCLPLIKNYIWPWLKNIYPV